MPLIIMGVIAGALFLVVFKLTIGSIESLGVGMTTYYPFEVRVRKPNLWSSLFFVVVVAILTLLVILLSGGNVPKLPA